VLARSPVTRKAARIDVARTAERNASGSMVSLVRTASSSRARLCLRPAALAMRPRHSSASDSAAAESFAALPTFVAHAHGAEKAPLQIAGLEIVEPGRIEREVGEQPADSGGLLVGRQVGIAAGQRDERRLGRKDARYAEGASIDEQVEATLAERGRELIAERS